MSRFAPRIIKSLSVQPVLRAAVIARPRIQLAAPLAIEKPVTMTFVRCYAKKGGKEKAGGKDKKKAAAAAVEEEVDFERQFDEKQIEQRFEQSITSLKEHLASMRIGRANPSLLDKVRVHIEHSHFALKDLAQVTVRDPQTLLVAVHDNDYLSAVDKSIREAGLNLNPIVDNKMIRVPIPKPSKESRDKLAKLVSTTGEQTKHKVRAIRQDGMKQLKHDSKHESADQIKKLEKQVQVMTDKYNKTVDELLKSKVKEIQS